MKHQDCDCGCGCQCEHEQGMTEYFLLPEYQEQMRLRMNFNKMMESSIGEHGIKPATLEAMLPEAGAAFERVWNRSMEGSEIQKSINSMKGWMDLPFNQQEIVEEILATADEINEWAENFVVLGIGGSALGPLAIQQALNHLHYNELAPEERGPRLYVEDNVDPERMVALLDIIDPTTTVFNVVTKSGATSETMAQYLIILNLLKARLGVEAVADHIIATTSEKRGNLIRIAEEEGFQTFYIPDGVGGRFSELCPVGLLPAAVCGIDIEAMLAGAAYMDQLCREADAWKNPALMAAMLQVAAMRQGMNISVMMPYADSLKLMSDWYAQLWAESLGKNRDQAGKPVHVGQTPVKALGVTDQHSQVQLYTEGPFDKVITFLGVEQYSITYEIPAGCAEIPAVSFLGGHTLNELIQAEQRATTYAVMKSGHASRTITLPEVNEFTIGQLLAFFEFETAFAGELLGINTFDQPGVEEGKNATYALLGRPGYEAKKAELDAAPAEEERYIL